MPKRKECSDQRRKEAEKRRQEEKRRMFREDQRRKEAEKRRQDEERRRKQEERARRIKYEAEMKRQKARQEAERRRYEAEMKRQQEAQRAQVERQRREAERQRQEEIRMEKEAERRRQQEESQRRQQAEQRRVQAAQAQQRARAEMNNTHERSTRANNWGGGNSIFLDRHNVDCGNKALKGFHLRRPRGNQLQYKYQCGGATTSAGIRKDSGTNHWGGGHTLYLIAIGWIVAPTLFTNSNWFALNHHSIRYNYKCGNRRHSGRCRALNTGFNQGHRMSIYLDRHKIRCHNDEVLKSFKLNRQPRTGWPGKMRYDYECCKI